jgi:large subunit ribosomal protein L17
MRHNAQVAHFGRGPDARWALIRGLVYSLVEHGRIETTVAKAKELRRHAERAVTQAKKGTLSARRLLLSRYPNETAVRTLMSDLAPRFGSRNGGYTRILKTGKRLGDSAEMALIEWVDYVLPSKSEDKAADKKGAKKAAKKAAPKKEASEAREKKESKTKIPKKS